MMFDWLIKSMMMYGAEMWVWKEQERLEAVQCKYLRLMLGLNKDTPKFKVLKETKRDQLKVEAGKRVCRKTERK